MYKPVTIKLVFINSYDYDFKNKEYIKTKSNIARYNCIACDAWWELDDWKWVEKHLDGKNCADFLDWLDHGSEPSEEYLEDEWKYCPE